MGVTGNHDIDRRAQAQECKERLLKSGDGAPVFGDLILQPQAASAVATWSLRLRPVCKLRAGGIAPG